ncbi:GNAT family N-acetyltransferase [Aquimarina sp. AD10]|uniref:GNAT family N-acetyltransferase n=1 Tax=Aquimarina sp. AD10 TaxID=1714849 RepID=UPI000E4C4961|nr:GNAT family N-acetyltransferase [Aquimarina sp. AD10]AXT62139.1 GNAT family N-acetyltransferase [Aquimarina sp. AD10]RKM99873.1 GNAT family N-acetyltransferase [Aquimarina sp. AD10]
MNINFTIATSEEELQQIITLQRKNLTASISTNEKQKEGFVTVQHDIEVLKKMNDTQAHIIAKSGDTVVGYALSMVKEFQDEIEILKPMFAKIDEILNPTTTYITMGQICIDKAYRKQGLFRGLYQTMKKELSKKYELLITEVAASNTRSLQAHYAVGFSDLLVYTSNDVIWHIVQWDWQ